LSHNPRLLPVTIAGVSYPVEPSGVSRGFLPVRPPRFTSGDVELLNPFGPLRFELTDWSLGAGQEFQDIETSSARRFWQSEGLDVSKDGRMSLVRNLEEKTMPSGVSTVFDVLPVKDSLYVSVNGAADKVYRTNNPEQTAPTWTAVGITTGENILEMAADGTHVYLARGTDGLWRTPIAASTPALFSSDDAFDVWFANGRLFTHGSNLELNEIAADGTATQVAVGDFSGWQFLVGAPNGIYVATYAGNAFFGDTLIYFLGINDDGTLAALRLALVVRGHGRVSVMLHVGGVLVLGGVNGVKLAVINGDDTLTVGPRFSGADALSLDGAGERIVTTGWNDPLSPLLGLPSDLSTGGHDVLLLNLSEFVEPLVPVRVRLYAVAFVPLGTSSLVVMFRHKPYCFNTLLGDMFGEPSAATLKPSGSLISGWIRHGVTEGKIPRAIDVRHEPLPAGASVRVRLHQEDGTVTTIGTSATDGSLGPSKPFPISGVAKGEKFRVELNLFRGTDTTEGPVVTSLALYAIPVPTRTIEWRLPVRLFAQSVTSAGTTHNIDADASLAALETLVKTRTVVTLEYGSESHPVTVENVEKAEGDRQAAWSDDGNGLEGIYMVTCHSADLQAA